jgi:hypothetical protein
MFQSHLLAYRDGARKRGGGGLVRAVLFEVVAQKAVSFFPVFSLCLGMKVKRHDDHFFWPSSSFLHHMHHTPNSVSRISCRIFSRRRVLGFTKETRKKGEARLFLEILLRLGNPDLQLTATCVWLFELPYGTMVHYLRFAVACTFQAHPFSLFTVPRFSTTTI